ncbi:unnamed protein product [Soboliphyme baturini]|uniref:Transposase n=1 Tax=Soboliphyme baturini TaxID=241478 RepID=A0A183I9N7_9BILA|nr:unnamed protein product [Soboliphyme baturini]
MVVDWPRVGTCHRDRKMTDIIHFEGDFKLRNDLIADHVRASRWLRAVDTATEPTSCLPRLTGRPSLGNNICP